MDQSEVDKKLVELHEKFPKMISELKHEALMAPLAGMIMLQETFKDKNPEKYFRVKFELESLKHSLLNTIERLEDLEKEYSNKMPS